MLMQRWISLWQQSFRSRQTRYLLFWLLAVYSAYLVWLGVRPIVFVSGALLCVVTLFAWPLASRSPTENSGNGLSKSDESNLLDKAVFHRRLKALCFLPPGVRLNETALDYWQKTYAQVGDIHQVAVTIASQESRFIPDLLDTLHTVLDLSVQFSRAFNAAKQVKTEAYQKVAQQQLRASTYRLSQTYTHLQELHDQLLLDGLEADVAAVASGVSKRLQLLIDTNKRELAT